jgi:aspartate 1-decarboxylase
MLVNILKSKIHRARVTATELEYEGSISIDASLVLKAGLLQYEKVLVVNLRNGERFETYVIEGKAGSGTVCVMGAAAHLCEKGDEVIIMSFTEMDSKEAAVHRPAVVRVDAQNRII